MLMATMMLGLSWSFVACSDDDESESSGAVDERELQVINGLVNNDEALLGSLLLAWVPDFTTTDVVNGICNKTFQAVVGEVVDPSQPMVRTLVMGTQEAADGYAVHVLGMLGINPQQPLGFSWSNPNIGSVSYERGSGNELSVINVSVRQLPGLTKIRLVKDFEGNVNDQPYYSKGDIVKYSKDNKYYICLNDHAKNNEAIWISFDCGEEINSLTTGTCGWMGTGNDTVYKAQASAQSIVWWLKEFVFNDDNYQKTLKHVAELSFTGQNQIIPSCDSLRQILIDNLNRRPDAVVLDVNTTINQEMALRATEYFSYTERQVKANHYTRIYYPFGLLLADNMRWSMGFTYDYWVPNIVLVSTLDMADMDDLMNSVSSQFSDESHFKFQRFETIMYKGRGFIPYVTAVHWTHKEYSSGAGTYKFLVNFTNHKRTYEKKAINLGTEKDLDWTLRNITSRQLTITDKGEAYSKFTTVYRAKEEVPVDLDNKVGWILASDGKLYPTKSDAMKNRVNPVAMVVYIGQPGEIESGTQYNALAMSIESYQQYAWSNAIDITCAEDPVPVVAAAAIIPKTLNGMAMTEMLALHECNESHLHPAAEFVYTMEKPVQDDDFSKWFIPSAGQFNLAMLGMGFSPFNQDLAYGGGAWKWSAAGYPGKNMMGWTTTEIDGGSVYTFLNQSFDAMNKNQMWRVHPVLAFNYKEAMVAK